MFCYFNKGLSMRSVDPGYAAVEGETVFDHYPATADELDATFPGYLDALTPLVADVRKSKLDALAARLETALNAGLAYFGKVLQIRAADQLNITTMGNEARWAKMTDAAWPADFAWRMADDSFLSVPSADDMIALGEAAKNEVYRLQQVKWTHADAIAGLTTVEAIDAYDIETGW